MAGRARRNPGTVRVTDARVYRISRPPGAAGSARASGLESGAAAQVFAGATEAVFVLLDSVLEAGDHAVVIGRTYQLLVDVPRTSALTSPWRTPGPGCHVPTHRRALALWVGAGPVPRRNDLSQGSMARVEERPLLRAADLVLCWMIRRGN